MKPTRPNGSERVDIHALITDQIVAAIEAGAGEFKMPWHRSKGSLLRPVNIATGNGYQGINILALWVAAETRGYSAPVWGTFKQWLDKGYPVRKGEKSVTGVFYKDLRLEETNDATGETSERKVGMRPSLMRLMRSATSSRIWSQPTTEGRCLKWGPAWSRTLSRTSKRSRAPRGSALEGELRFGDPQQECRVPVEVELLHQHAGAAFDEDDSLLSV